LTLPDTESAGKMNKRMSGAHIDGGTSSGGDYLDYEEDEHMEHDEDLEED
jgi:hypothetical protein